MGLKPKKGPAAYNFIGNIEKALTRARVCLQAAQQRQKRYADDKRVDRELQVGDSVYLSSEHIILEAIGARKLLPGWLGPFNILSKVNTVNYTLDIPAHYKVHHTFHVSMLRPAFDNECGESRPPLIMIDGEEEFELQHILQHRPPHKTRSSTGISYLVRWKGYGPAYNSWEPGQSLRKNAPESLKEYWDELETALQAAGSGLAPDNQIPSATRGRSRGSGHISSQVRGRRTVRGRGRGSLRPVSRKLKGR